ncbi:MAG: hypothetical protein COW54_15645 [Rhodobacteraceae bacterium CG17_big_fil_post_rev_8_21_14_2_50_63_15]|nr:hypothetical protein [Roseovarius sp.]PIV77202.1 MAG: hypothetical protein COW54_15645 [Rhodobacteraceae bacterium CG17_big_fil_post_rev_8_21_14_2_50_63_15]
MHLDVQDLRNFYYRDPLGRAVQSAVRAQIATFWREAQGQTVVGYGFAVPFLRPYLADARRVIGLMPAPQGVIAWPQGLPNISVLCEETFWPVETGHVDKLLVVHGLETSDQAGALLEECWRVLGPGGSALFIVPNRAGLWSRSDRTPFGYGRPYSQAQIETELKLHNFMPERHATALYQPPSGRRFWRKTARLWERIGARLSVVAVGGVLMIEATKRVQVPSGPGLRTKVRRPLQVLTPQPEAKPV